MTALTRTEARTRARLLDVERYDVHLDLTRGEDTFTSTTTVRFTAREPHAHTFVDVHCDTLHSATLDGTPLDPARLTDGRLPLHDLTQGTHELHIAADMPYSHVGEGMHRFTDPADGHAYVYTQCFMADAPRVYACFDQPDLKAVFHVTVTAPQDWTVLGNGTAHRTTDGHWQCAPTPPMSTYLMAVAAGPYHSVHGDHAGLPLGLHVRRSLAPHLDADADELLDLTRRCLDRYHEIFDEPYPYDSYDQAFVPEFNAGAMENPGLVTFRDEYVFRSAVTDTERQLRAVVIAHEMAHMWFGDLVTLQWWDDIWLNESFAEYMGYQIVPEATRHTTTWTDFATARKAWGYDADQRPSTHPVAPDPDAVPDTASAGQNFDGISYAKGASALRQLVAWLGEKTFLAGINDHITRHRFANATLADFIDSLAHASDRDVHAWARRWLRTTGVDTLTTRITPEADGAWTLTVDHHGSRPHHLTVGLYDHAPDQPAQPPHLVLRERPEGDLPADGGALTTRSTSPLPALVVPNDADLTYAKVRLDDASWETARAALSGIPDPLTRAVVWNAARDMVRDGHLAPAAYLEAAHTHAHRETDNAVLHSVLTFARAHIADRHLPPHRRTPALDRLTDTCRTLLDRTRDDDTAGLRLTAVRHLIDCATTPDELRAWWTTGTVPDGPTLDPELRWRILLRLSVLGALTPDEIDAALAADPSATGQEGAARCRAALPDPAAKATAWNTMFAAVPESAAPSNYHLTATAQGFWQPEHHELLAPYAERYFDDAPALAQRRGESVARIAGRYAFPHTFVDAATLHRGQACLARDDLQPALRRQLTDQLDDLGRALRIREAIA